MPITNKKDKKFISFFEKPYKILTKDEETTLLTAIIMYFKLKLVAKRNNMEFSENLEYEKLEFNFGIQKIGSLNSRYKVYKNPYMTENVILMGYKGTQFLECGAVFAPYVPLIMTPLLYDPNTFTPRKGLMTRYAKKMIRPDYYGKIFVSGLNTI
jgi:hypothetical protein